MELKTSKDYRIALGIKEDLDYFIERLKEVPSQDYLTVGDLEKTRTRIIEDLEKYSEDQKTKCPFLIPGNIIRISGGDGISYSQHDYYKILEVKQNEIKADHIKVIRGDYGNGIEMDERARLDKEDFITSFNRNYHTTEGLEENWKALTEYADKVPWLK